MDIEQALRKERERIAWKLAEDETDVAAIEYQCIDCGGWECGSYECWLAYLQPPKNSEEAPEPAEGAES